jgi:hypothetical protein
MKYFVLILAAGLLTSFSNDQLPNFKNPELTKEEVNAILGSNGKLVGQKDSSGTGSYIKKKRTYQAETEKSSYLYYTYERFASAEDAHQLIESYIASNKEQQGFETLSGFGDEGFYHTDKKNFGTLVLRKSNLLILLKVNKISSKTNFESIKNTGRAILTRNT